MTATECRHVSANVYVSIVKRQLQQPNPSCRDCRPAKSSKRKKTSAPKTATPREELWICLTCGEVHCGRSSPGQHAVKHQSKHGKHAVALNLATGKAWCYKCDAEVFDGVLDDGGGGEEAPRTGLTRIQELAAIVLNRAAPAGGKKKGPSYLDDIDDGLDADDDDDDRFEVRAPDEPAGPASNRKAAPSQGGPPGLSNLGNTCFFNSAMQNLARVQVLREHFGADSGDSAEGAMTNALREFFRGFGAKTAGVYNPGGLFKTIAAKHPRFRGYQQQDAQELLRAVVETVHDEEARRLGLSKKEALALHESIVVDRAFGGRIESSVTCLDCGHVSTVRDPVYDLSLEIAGPSGSAGGVGTDHLKQKVVKKRFSTKQLRKIAKMARQKRAERKRSGAAVDDAEDEASGASTVATEPDEEPARDEEGADEIKATRRRQLDGEATGLEKCMQAFTDIEELDGDNKVECEACTKDAGEKQLRASSKQILVLELPQVLVLHLKRFRQTARGAMRKVSTQVSFPERLDMEPFCAPATTGPFHYRLRGIVVHSGGLFGGHYIAEVEVTGTGWFRISDSQVRGVTAQQVHAAEAFMLFYERE